MDHVWFVDLNPHNRAFVQQRADALGLGAKLSTHRDLAETGEVRFDTVVCLVCLSICRTLQRNCWSFTSG